MSRVLCHFAPASCTVQAPRLAVCLAQALAAAQARADADAARAAAAEQRLADAERRLAAAGPGPQAEPDQALPLEPQPQPQPGQPGRPPQEACAVDCSTQTELHGDASGGDDGMGKPSRNSSREGSRAGEPPLLPLAMSAAAGLENAGCCAAAAQGVGPGDAGRASQNGDPGNPSSSGGRPPAGEVGWRFAPGRLDAATPAGIGLGLESDAGCRARCHASPVRLVFAEQAPADRPSARARLQTLSDAEEPDLLPSWGHAAPTSGLMRRGSATAAEARAAAAGAACQSGTHEPVLRRRIEPAEAPGASDARAAGRVGAGSPEQHQPRPRHSDALHHSAADASPSDGAASRVSGGSRRRLQGAGAAAHGGGSCGGSGRGVGASDDEDRVVAYGRGGGAAAKHAEDLRCSHRALTARGGGHELGGRAYDDGAGLGSSSGDEGAGSTCMRPQRLRAPGAAARGGGADDEGFEQGLELGFSSGNEGPGVHCVEALLAQAEAAARRSAGRARSAPAPKPWADARAGDDDICRWGALTECKRLRGCARGAAVITGNDVLLAGSRQVL